MPLPSQLLELVGFGFAACFCIWLGHSVGYVLGVAAMRDETLRDPIFAQVRALRPRVDQMLEIARQLRRIRPHLAPQPDLPPSEQAASMASASAACSDLVWRLVDLIDPEAPKAP